MSIRAEVDAKYPEHTKLQKVKDLSQACGGFVEWLGYEKGIWLAHHVEFEEREDAQLSTLGVPPIQELLGEHFGIDYDELMREKGRMLDEIREAQS